MNKKTIVEGGKRAEILSAALTLFLENGYEKTSVRMISKEVGCEVGLVYYYFKTKEEVFEQALSSYFSETEEEIESLSKKIEFSMEKNLEKFMNYIEAKADVYRKAFSESVHLSVRTMIREKIAVLSEKYFICILENDGKKDVETLALFLSRSICGAALCDDTEYYQANKDSILRTAKKMLEIETKEIVSKKKEMPSFLL
ncbi:MAG: TetR/AcrR family transcriptional regulator [Ruminococcaceae bacterium]|nr:TetR/AcrR family transcriptional regulator [Oscillospiraceae bacterium]